MILFAIIVCASSFVDTSQPMIFSKSKNIWQYNDLPCSVPPVALSRISFFYRLRGGSDHLNLGPSEFQSLQNTAENSTDLISERGPSHGESDQHSNFAEERNNDRPMGESESSEDSDACVDEGGLPLNSNFSEFGEANASSSRGKRGSLRGHGTSGRPSCLKSMC